MTAVAAMLGDVRARERSAAALHVADVSLGGAVALWVLALRWTHVGSMNDFGLVSVLPVAYFGAVALLLVGFVAEVTRQRPSVVRMALLVLGLIVVFHGTAPALFPLPRYSWVYKHLGVVRTVVERGSLSRTADIYGSWPGFFGAAAWVASVAGVRDPTVVVAWAQVLFNVVFAVELLWLYRAVGASVRQQWTAIVVFVLGNWVAQDYLAPQAVAYALSLAAFAVLFTWFVRPGGGRLDRWAGRMVRSKVQPVVVAQPGRAPVAAFIGFGLVFMAVVVSHPLSPFVLIAAVAAMTLLGAVRPRWLVLVMVAATVLYMIPRFDFVASNYGIFHAIGNFFTNAQNNALSQGGLPGRLATAAAARYLSMGVWVLALLGAVVRLRRGAPTAVLAALVVTPAFVLAAQNYGGEAIFRVYLFSLPWAALLAAELLPAARLWRPRLASAAAVLVATAMAGLFLQAYFGGEDVNQTAPSDLAAADWFYSHASPGSVLVLAAPNFPTRDSADYDQFLRFSASSDPNLMGEPRFRGQVLDAALLPRIEKSILFQLKPGTPTYLVIGEGQRIYCDTYGIVPHGSLDVLDHTLSQSVRWKLVFHEGQTSLYEFVDAWS